MTASICGLFKVVVFLQPPQLSSWFPDRKSGPGQDQTAVMLGSGKHRTTSVTNKASRFTSLPAPLNARSQKKAQKRLGLRQVYFIWKRQLPYFSKACRVQRSLVTIICYMCDTFRISDCRCV